MKLLECPMISYVTPNRLGCWEYLEIYKKTPKKWLFTIFSYKIALNRPLHRKIYKVRLQLFSTRQNLNNNAFWIYCVLLHKLDIHYFNLNTFTNKTNKNNNNNMLPNQRKYQRANPLHNDDDEQPCCCYCCCFCLFC